MAIYTSFVVSSFRALDEARKKAKRRGVDMLQLMGDANVDLDWKDLFAMAFLKHLAAEAVTDARELEAFMVEPIEAPNYVFFSLPDELVDTLANWSAPRRAAMVESCEKVGFIAPSNALAGLEALARRAHAGSKNLYLCIHVP